MYVKYSDGFSKVAFLVTFLIILLLLGGGAVGAYFVKKQLTVTQATEFMTSFTKQVENNDTAATFNSFSTSLKESNNGTAYGSWVLWSSAFKENGITIEQPAYEISYEDSSIGAVFGDKSPILFSFNTSVDTKIRFSVIHDGSTWVVVEYAAL